MVFYKHIWLPDRISTSTDYHYTELPRAKLITFAATKLWFEPREMLYLRKIKHTLGVKATTSLWLLG